MPIITYGCENLYTIRKKNETKANTIKMKHLRSIYIMGKAKSDRIKNEDTKKIGTQEMIVEKITMNRQNRKSIYSWLDKIQEIGKKRTDLKR